VSFFWRLWFPGFVFFSFTEGLGGIGRRWRVPFGEEALGFVFSPAAGHALSFRINSLSHIPAAVSRSLAGGGLMSTEEKPPLRRLSKWRNAGRARRVLPGRGRRVERTAMRVPLDFGVTSGRDCAAIPFGHMI